MSFGFAFDAAACVGCQACVAACLDAADLPAAYALRRVETHEYGSWIWEGGVPVPRGVGAFSVSIACNHCVRPACVAACPTGAMAKDPVTGIVAVADDVCVGCGRCARACPYGAIQVVPRAADAPTGSGMAPGRQRSRRHALKCDACRSLPKGPACAAACPMRCLAAGPIEELRYRWGSTAQGPGLPDARLTQPNLAYGPPRGAYGSVPGTDSCEMPSV